MYHILVWIAYFSVVFKIISNTSFSHVPILVPEISLHCFADQCFMTGNYQGNDIDFVENINDSTRCQEECQKHYECKFWTYNSDNKRCFRQTANAPDTLGTCDACIRGPRNCTSK